MKKIVAVVVTYNRCELLKECIEALLKSNCRIDILIIDNASTDDTKDIVNSFLINDNIKYFNTGKNLGGAGGFNYGIRRGYELGYDYIWVMDDDTIVNPDSLGELLNVIKDINGNFGWLSSLALWTDGKKCVMNYHVVDNHWYHEKKSIIDGRLRCQAATFVSLLINRKAVQRVGLPITDYFIWGDDTEYTKRISDEFHCYFVPGSQVIHKMKSNEGTSKIEDVVDENRINRMFYSVRNDFCTYKKRGKLRTIRFIVIQLKSIGKVMKSNKPYKWKKIKVLIKGLWAGVWFNPKIEKIE